MTEINNNLRAQAQAQPQQQQPQGRRPTVADANRIPGLGSGLDTQRTLNTLMQVERQRLQPVEQRKLETRTELESFNLLKQGLEALQETTSKLASTGVWEAKIVESNNEDVVTATATSGAEPGKHTLVVDRLALNHQIASQGFESTDDLVGRGRFRVGIGENTPVNITIDDTNDTLTGLKDAINSATDDVSATVIKTGNRNQPYQLVLTSQKTGTEGRINLEITLEGGEAPNFQNSVEAPSEWAGVGEAPPPSRGALTGTGASTAIVRVIGEYAGEEDTQYKFTAIQTGVVGGESGLQLRWTDNQGRSGIVELDAFNYAPGEPKEFVDGLSLVVSQGEIIVGDEFSFNARPPRPSLAWWLTEAERQPGFTQPSAWSRQATTGTPVIEGEYTGEEDANFTLRVEGGGQIGAAKNLRLHWENDQGDSGILPIGLGYEPGSKLAITDGLTLTLKPGVLAGGSTATFSVEAAQVTGQWWKDDAERRVPPTIGDVSNFSAPEADEDDAAATQQPEFPEEFGPRVSSSQPTVSGVYEGDKAKAYTFTAVKDGSVGVTSGMAVRWEDEEGNSGRLELGETYQLGQPLPFDAGLSIAFGAGRIFNEDSFTVRTRTSTIQPPQDAEVRLGATELGGGLPITNSTNELENVIDGIKLNLVAASKDPVTVTIRGDTEQAVASVLGLVQAYNDLVGAAAELSKYDQEKDQAGPLLGDSDLTTLRNSLSELLINPVPGLPPTANMVFTLGLRLNDKGMLDVDESAVRNKIQENFAAASELFRERGKSDNSGIAFVGMSQDTRPSPDGLEVDISQVAKAAEYITPPLGSLNMVTEPNNQFFITVDGRQSELLTLEPGMYEVSRLAQAIQNAITNDPQVGELGVRVASEQGRIRVISGRPGSRSSIDFSTAEDITLPAALAEGTMLAGQDVAGTIGGEDAQGLGNLLRGRDESERIKGLRLLVNLSENQLSPSVPEGRITITKGVGSRMNAFLEDYLDPVQGRMKTITQNLNTELKSIDKQLERMEERIESKRSRLQDRFARMESQLSSLKGQQRYMSSQLASLPGGGGAPGLPGL